MLQHVDTIHQKVLGDLEFTFNTINVLTHFQSANFDLEFGPDYYPAFEVRLPTTTEEVTLMIKDQGDTVVWEHDVDLTGKTSSCALSIAVAGGIMLSVVRFSFSPVLINAISQEHH